MRWSFGLDNPNHAATLCAMALVVGYAFILVDPARGKRFTGGLLLAFSVFALAMTRSRGGFIAAFIGCGTMAFFYPGQRHKPFLWLLLPVSIWLALTLFLPGHHLSWLSSSSALTERLTIWRAACQIAWEAGFTGAGVDGFTEAFNLWHNQTNADRIWFVALGDPQTLSTTYGWWAAGLWIGIPVGLFHIGCRGARQNGRWPGLALIGASLVWVISTTISDHRPDQSVVAGAYLILLSLTGFILYGTQIKRSGITIALSVGFSLGAFIPPLLGWVFDREQEVKIHLVHAGKYTWWEAVAPFSPRSRIILAAPLKVTGVGAFVRKMSGAGCSIIILQSLSTPRQAAQWMEIQYHENRGILMGVGPYAPSAITAALRLDEKAHLITWGGPLENPVMDTSGFPLHRLSWWAFLGADDEAASYRPRFRSLSDARSLWLTASVPTLGTPKEGLALADQIIKHHPALQFTPPE